MSNTDQRWHSLLKDLELHIPGSLKPLGHQRNDALFKDVLTLWTCRIFDILSFDHSIQDCYRILRGWLTSWQGRSYLDVLSLMDKSIDLLLQADEPTYDSFKRSLSNDFEFAGEMISPAKRSITGWIRDKDPSSFSRAYSFFSFPLRVNLDREELREKALAQYLEREQALSTFGGDVHNIAPIVHKWYKTYLPEDFLPKHGPGSTADAGRVMESKYRHLGRDVRTDYLHLGDFCGSDARDFTRISKLVFVPKSYKALRSISMEPATLMWLQQGVLRSMSSDLRGRLRHGLGKHYTPENPELNRELAWIGSIDGSYATIDLTAASDSVSWALVKKVFDKTPLLRWLLCTRSTHTLLPDSTTMLLNKFAPMGSALCFPIQVVIFSAIVESVMRDYPAFLDKQYAVYGDDIVVSSEHAPIVVERLQDYGFLPNQKKTYLKGIPNSSLFFRESCGGEYLSGEDVGPLRIPRLFEGFPERSNYHQTTASCIELANQAHNVSPSVRRVLIDKLKDLPVRVQPLFDDSGERGLFSCNPTNFHLRQRWNENLQRMEYQHGTVRMIGSQLGNEDIRFYECLRAISTRERVDLPHVSAVGRLGTPYWKSVWSALW